MVDAIECDDAVVVFEGKRGVAPLRAVDGVSLRVQAGETLGLIGESGSGKSTLARSILGLQPLASGSVRVDGVPVFDRHGRPNLELARKRQVVFQDSQAALDPRSTIGASIAEPLEICTSLGRKERAERVAQLLTRVNLPPDLAHVYPHQVSGGQRQRVNIARALALDPEVLICDEAVSALDVSLRAGILNLLVRTQREAGLAMLFITHDIEVVSHISDRIAVMYLGRIIETGPAEEIVERPRHPYTMSLLASQPSAIRCGDAGLEKFLSRGEIPSPRNPPSGCRYRTRCPFAQAICAERDPHETETALTPTPGHFAACHFAGEIEFTPAISSTP